MHRWTSLSSGHPLCNEMQKCDTRGDRDHVCFFSSLPLFAHSVLRALGRKPVMVVLERVFSSFSLKPRIGAEVGLLALHRAVNLLRPTGEQPFFRAVRASANAVDQAILGQAQN